MTVSLFLLLIVIAVVLAAIGLLAEGLLWLLFIGIAIFVLDLILLGARIGRCGGKPPVR